MTNPVITTIVTEFFTAKVGEQEYSNVAAHKLHGFSMYSHAHPQVRDGKDIQGADVYVSAHTHRKGHADQPIKVFGGGARWIHYISVGDYKATDDYAKKKGFPEQSPSEMYGSAVVLEKDTEAVTYYNYILVAND